MSNITQFFTGGRETAEELTSGSGNWTVPPGVSWVRVFLVGGGGGGGSGDFSNPATGGGGGGGGGGMILYTEMNVTPGGTVPYAVGAGGVAGAAQPVSPTAPATGGNGGNTIFGSFTAYGGGGGGRGTPTSGVGAGGAGGRGVNYFGVSAQSWVGNLRFSESAGGAPGGGTPQINRRGATTSFSLGGQTLQGVPALLLSPVGIGGGGGAGYINPAGTQSGGLGANVSVNATTGTVGGGGGGGANRTPTNPLGGGSSAGAAGGNGYILITYMK